MKTDDVRSAVPSAENDVATKWDRLVRRRSFLKGIGAVGAAVPAATLLAGTASAADAAGRRLTKGDADILRFLLAAEIIETDLWQQYRDLGGVNGGNPAYIAALSNIDGDMPQYVTDNTEDEETHVAFLTAYLKSRGARAVSLDGFRRLPPSKATGASQVKRLTNLMSLDVDTTWYTRYRSNENPDLGAHIPQALSITHQPTIPLDDVDTPPGTAVGVPPLATDPAVQRIQAIANAAAWHFPSIEVGGSSLYTTMALKCTSLEVLRVVLSIGGTEIDHFSLWHDKTGNTVSTPPGTAGVTDPATHLFFPDFNTPQNDLRQPNLILPEPCDFLSEGLPEVSVIRPTSVENGGAVAAVKGFASSRLFLGQKEDFLDTLMELAIAADAAQREA